MASILVVGAGAVGLGLGSALLQAGERVTFVARGDTAAALRGAGCARRGILGEHTFRPDTFGVIETPSQLREPPDTLLVATKSTASAEVARDLAAVPAIARSPAPIVLAQNGLGNAEIFFEHFVPERVFNARVITGFRRDALHCVEITVHADAVRVGSLSGRDPDPVAGFAEALSRGGIPAATTPDIGAWLWAKVLYNCALNPLGALLGVPYGELARGESTRRLMELVVREVFAVMRACGGSTHWQDADAYLAHFYETLLPATAGHESSMLQDVRASRRTEIDALCGEIATRGAAENVPTPVNQALTRLIHALEPALPRPA